MSNSETNSDESEVVALNGLRFIASEAARFSRFLKLTGIAPDEIPGLARQPEFLASVMDYLLSDERLLLEFAESEALDPLTMTKLRRKLPGAFSL